MFSGALCRGLIEAGLTETEEEDAEAGFSAALCRGLIEARPRLLLACRLIWRFPRLYAAASLKPQLILHRHCHVGLFSAALCRGLIEAVPFR